MALEEGNCPLSKRREKIKIAEQSEGYGHFEGGTVDLQFSCE